MVACFFDIVCYPVKRYILTAPEFKVILYFLYFFVNVTKLFSSHDRTCARALINTCRHGFVSRKNITRLIFKHRFSDGSPRGLDDARTRAGDRVLERLGNTAFSDYGSRS